MSDDPSGSRVGQDPILWTFAVLASLFSLFALLDAPASGPGIPTVAAGPMYVLALPFVVVCALIAGGRAVYLWTRSARDSD